MQAPEPSTLQVIDTAIKIGLPSLFTAFGALGAAYLNRRKDLDKEDLTIRISLLKGIASNVDEFYACITAYMFAVPVPRNLPDGHALDPITVGRLRNQPTTVSSPAAFEEKRNRARDAVRQLTLAGTHLSLLGLSQTLEILKVYKKAAEEFWLETGDLDNPVEAARFLELKQEIGKKHWEFFESLSKAFPVGKR